MGVHTLVMFPYFSTGWWMTFVTLIYKLPYNMGVYIYNMGVYMDI